MTPKDKTKFKEGAQRRFAAIGPAAEGARRFDSEQYVEGYATTYDEYLLYDDYGDGSGKVYERFERGCFDNTDMSDVVFLYNHEGRVYARSTNNTLFIGPDDKGLFTAEDLSQTAGARGIYEDIAAGLITKMSWAFLPGDYDIERRAGTKDITIVHRSVRKIYDVSAVSFPANDNTSISARAWCDGVIAAAARREAELDDIRKKIRLRIKISEVLHHET